MQQKSTKKQEETFYTIEAILSQKSIQNQIYYLIKWEGYPIEESTWEPAYKIAETSELFGEYKMKVRKEGPNFYQRQNKHYMPPPIEQFNIIRKKTKLELISDLVEGINQIKDCTQQIAQHSKILKDHSNPTELHHYQENGTQTDSKMKSSQVKKKEQPQQAVIPIQEQPMIPLQTPSKVNASQPEPIKENPQNVEVIQQDQKIIQQQQSTSKKNQQEVAISVKEEEEPICQIPLSDFNKSGSFENGDQIQRVGKSVIVRETGQKRYFVLWKKRAEGYYPKSSWISSQELLEKDPKAICRYIKGVMRL